MLKQSESGVISQGLVWVPKSFDFETKIRQVIDQEGLNGLTFEKGPDEVPGLTKPTYYRTNDFTFVFQLIVETYGIPTYKEANPAYLSCISFPFYFGIMFGDIFHGTILLAFSIWLCNAKRSPGSLAESFGPVRYIFLLMGLFSMYCGFIYNDMTSMGTEFFGKSCFDKLPAHGRGFATKSDPNCVYSFGIDPIWYQSPDEITYLNSFKMKTAVIFGVF